MKQERLSILEEKLNQADRNEGCLLFLGKSRCDANGDRLSILNDIEKSLADYGMLQEIVGNWTYAY